MHYPGGAHLTLFHMNTITPFKVFKVLLKGTHGIGGSLKTPIMHVE